MPIDESPAIVRYLNARNTLLAGKAEELRAAVVAWLEYIPQTFPHYTRHTVHHSDAIIRQLSLLLFDENDPERPVIRLSPIECYVLIASAYLHDAGMVTSDAERTEILGSEEWTAWVQLPAQAPRWREIVELHRLDTGDGRAHFSADVLTRHLLAEFVRRSHHERSGMLIDQSQEQLGRFAFDDPLLQLTIRQVCVSHGLSLDQLEDREAYPDVRDVLRGQVNVRLMAVLLRLGDLLDLESDRACPLLLNAASPLPAESYAHWSQYPRIVQKVTTPQSIEIVAECETQEEHRLLQDWCQWLANEVGGARRLLTGSRRHGAWQPPTAAFEPGSIQIRPSRTAKYLPLDWKFELDAEQVFARLIHDAYPTALAFVRELLQNALDATRCRVTGDLRRGGHDVPASLDDLPDEARSRYPVKISLEVHTRYNELSGAEEEHQVLIVEDRGIGMNADIAQRYLLQVGRSFYQSEEFRRRYGFIPTSRFGVGFLSVFAASDHVTVSTLTEERPASAMRLTLTGPRNYLLIERDERTEVGTKVRLVLRHRVQDDHLVARLREWCRFVEFPIQVVTSRGELEINRETPSDWLFSFQPEDAPNRTFELRALPLSDGGVKGHFYHLVSVADGVEDWASAGYGLRRWYDDHPYLEPPEYPGPVVALHGIAMSSSRTEPDYPAVYRIDDRTGKTNVGMGRERVFPRGSERWSGVAPIVEAYVLQHASQRSVELGAVEAWEYKQRLVETFANVVPGIASRMPGVVRVWDGASWTHKSADDMRASDQLNVVVSAVAYGSDPTDVGSIENAFTREVLRRTSHRVISAVFDSRGVADVNAHNGAWRFVFRDASACEAVGRDAWIVSGLPRDVVGVSASLEGRTFRSDAISFAFNADNEFVAWLLRFAAAARQEGSEINSRQVASIVDRLTYCARWIVLQDQNQAFQRVLAGWRSSPTLPADLRPPSIDFTYAAFGLAADPGEHIT